jgi:hypothetical protein
MAILKMSRRLLIAGAFTVAVTVTPVVIATGLIAPGGGHTLADPSSTDSSSSDASHMTTCSTKHDINKHDTNISYSLSCQLSAPLPSGAAGGNGQLSEQTLTAQRH